MSIAEPDLRRLPAGAILWRLHPTAGPHVQAWNRLRCYGPTPARFDPHPDPAGLHTAHAVSYTAMDAVTGLAEVYQRTRVIATHDRSPRLTAWRTARILRLLDLTGSWPIRAGASYALNTGRHDHCRAWARAVHDHPAAVDGLYHHSAMTGRPCVTLFTPARDSFPRTAEFSRALDDPGFAGTVGAIARQIGYRVSS